MNELQRSVAKGTYVAPTALTVGEYLEQWLDGARAHRQPESPEMPTWSAEELHAFLEHVADDPDAALWRLAATTGMRRGELVALRWRDVDCGAARVTVVQQLAKGGGTVTAGPTKTRRRLRGPGTRLLPTRRPCPASRPAHPDVPPALQGGRAALHQAAGPPPHPRHAHTSAGVHPKVVQERLGHSSIAITVDTYSHAIPGMQEDAAAQVAALVDGQAQAREGEQR